MTVGCMAELDHLLRTPLLIQWLSKSILRNSSYPISREVQKCRNTRHRRTVHICMCLHTTRSCTGGPPWSIGHELHSSLGRAMLLCFCSYCNSAVVTVLSYRLLCGYRHHCSYCHTRQTELLLPRNCLFVIEYSNSELLIAWSERTAMCVTSMRQTGTPRFSFVSTSSF